MDLTKLSDYIEKAWDGVTLAWAFVLATVNYLLFPDKAFQTLLGCVLGAALLDIGTRWYAIGKRKSGLSSKKFWDGTSVKLVAYLVIALLAGMSYRMAPFLQQPVIYLWSVAYAVMFLREAQSVVENMCDAGAKLEWLLLWTKRKQEQILNDQAPGPYGITSNPYGWEQQAASAEWGQRPPPTPQGEDPWREP